MVFRVVISMTATVVSAANERHEHQGNTTGQGEHHFHNWHDHRHHHHHDHYYNGVYYPEIETQPVLEA